MKLTTPALLCALLLLVFGCVSCGNAQPNKQADADPLKEHSIPDSMGCFASVRVFFEGNKVGYLYREAPEFAQDSGWRILAGTESRAFADDPENWRIVDLAAIVALDPPVAELLDLPVGTELERIPNSARFVQINTSQTPSSQQTFP